MPFQRHYRLGTLWVSATVELCASRSWTPEVNRRRSSPTGFVDTCLGRSNGSKAREHSFQLPRCDSETPSSYDVASPGGLAGCRGCLLLGEESGTAPLGVCAIGVADLTKGRNPGVGEVDATCCVHPIRRKPFEGPVESSASTKGCCFRRNPQGGPGRNQAVAEGRVPPAARCIRTQSRAVSDPPDEARHTHSRPAYRSRRILQQRLPVSLP